ncbi:hypothetical protein CPC735_021980 [Coccidioides posadasii C735 delta SOWgp]|uniref:Aminoglycoside phosphotransferase domain-containing protein n=1 Tax=Coccidioides posadasii (strain C735) TaxID=222929 RepID=C5PJK0_COCP7|nr:hypothetical protein CPC735_021980 [Coccidioides posadasii C735 delta SOWgp]EER22899.1 hypothetical protein CPC735_021980 [Coccidioides posadasii C735 delta SOWgp]|eukprot:XP_003065044.1 hypothetical protein CPC735_021980 [Coccidioides posadasii C735 delta SOWgp]
MADDEVQELRRLLEYEQNRRLAAEQGQREAEQAQWEAEQAQRAAEQAQRAAEQVQRAAEEKTRRSTLPEYLDACHTHLFLGLVPGQPKRSTKGSANNADGKLRPDRIREWVPFAEAQTAIWDQLVGDDLVTQRHFSSLHGLMTIGENMRKTIRSEPDLRHFQRDAVTAPVGSVIEALYKNERLRQAFNLQGHVAFENHANTLSDGEGEGEGEEVVARPSKLRKGTGGAATPNTPPTSARPLADEFCVYNEGEKVKRPALIGELKPPHKLPLAVIQAGLQDMDLDDIVECHSNDTSEIQYCRLVAAVITQAFSYMIKAGVEYGYVSTGEAFIFLHSNAEDPGTVYYYLSVPEQDVGEITGFTGELDSDNRLHMTAVGQVLAFALQAIQTSPHNQNWRTWAEKQLKVWVISEEDSQTPTPAKAVKSSPPYEPLKSAQMFIQRTPVRTRSKSARLTCKATTALPGSSDKDDDDSGPDSDSPSQRPHWPSNVMVVPPPPPDWASPYKGPVCKDGTRRYCTQKCLLGLVNGGLLDRGCPNVEEHGTDNHRIDHATFIALLEAQIQQEPVNPWTPLGCESLHTHGARGALFEVDLLQYGYTFVGKGFPREFHRYLRHEKAVYDQLQPIQGVHVPVCLGTIDVSKQPMCYDGIAYIPHFLLLAHAGTDTFDCGALKEQVISAALKSLRAIHALGVLHRDIELRNMFWTEESKSILVIDFERAGILRCERAPLGDTSPNQRRKRRIRRNDGPGEETKKKVDVRQDRINKALESELRWMVRNLETSLKS